VLTPFYSEDVAYSNADLLKENEDGVSNMSYLQSIYPREWRNFLERVGEPDADRTLILNSAKGGEARSWASHRGQTLSRTVNGMMLYQRALKLLAEIEQPTLEPERMAEMLRSKFSYVVSCQVYGQQKKNGDRQAADIDALLIAHPNLRVAYTLYGATMSTAASVLAIACFHASR
jgi:callose synthase